MAGQNIRKYYQRRLPSNPAKDYYYIMRDTPDNETVIVEYGFADSTGDDVSQIKNDWENLAEAVVKAITDYAGGAYVAPLDSNYYTVVSGDTLWSIANKYGITVNELKEANNLSSNLLSVGQNLIIPSDEETDVIEYVVQSGDTLYGIANTYGTTVDNLMDTNNLTTTSLAIGQILKIPTTTDTSTETYTVVSGDTLYSIASKYGTTVDNLKDINNLSSNILSIGQVLYVPTTEDSTITYIVQSGDTLYSIANTYNTTVDEIKSLNNLTSNLLSINQVLKLPTSSDITYTVVSGDTLYSIANKFGTTVDAVKSLNNLSTTVLSIGQKLLIP